MIVAWGYEKEAAAALLPIALPRAPERRSVLEPAQVAPTVPALPAVIPAAGRGTRMRPATRVVPKSLLTVIDRPAIQYSVEEAARAGAKEAVVVVEYWG